MVGFLIHLEGEHTASGPTLGGPNTGCTIGGALLGSPGENITKLGTNLPLCYQSLFPLRPFLYRGLVRCLMRLVVWSDCPHEGSPTRSCMRGCLWLEKVAANSHLRAGIIRQGNLSISTNVSNSGSINCRNLTTNTFAREICNGKLCICYFPCNNYRSYSVRKIYIDLSSTKFECKNKARNFMLLPLQQLPVIIVD